MKINLETIDKTKFRISESEIAGDKVFLINPENNVNWTRENIIFRSSIWNEQGESISLGFKKFFNWDEQVQQFPAPSSIKNLNIIEKIDGSCLIVSKYKEQLIIRTRGTFDARKLENGYEIDLFIKRYPKIFDNNLINADYSLLFEWISPTNQIVIQHNEPDIILIGIVGHEKYEYVKQEGLNRIAATLNLKRPAIFNFNSFDEMFTTVQSLKNKEGIVVYYNNDQEMKKLKSPLYLALHAFRFDMSINKMLDLFCEINYPSYNDFLVYIEKNFDWECAQFAIPFISKIEDAYSKVLEILEGMKKFIEPLKFVTRKEAAEKILSSYGNTNRASFCFTLLDGKELSNEQIKKLIYQNLKQ